MATICRLLGVNVVPIVPSTKVPPCGFDLSRWYEQHQSDDDLDALKTKYGLYAAAWVTGRVSGIIALDFDSPDAEAWARANWDLPETLAVKSARGLKLIYSTVAHITTRPFRGVEGLDIKGDRGYVVVPPAPGRYWVMPDDSLEYLIAPCPKSLEEDLASEPAHDRQLSIRQGNRDTAAILDTRHSVVAEADGKLRETSLTLPDLVKEDLLGWITSLLDRPEIEEVLVKYLGLRKTGKFLCPVHSDEEHPSAQLERNRRGRAVLRCWHLAGESDKRPSTLAETYVSKINRRTIRLTTKPARAVWLLRLLVDAGVLEAVPVDALPVPADIYPEARIVYEGFVHLLRVRLVEPGVPSPYSWKFAATWCGIPRRAAAEAVEYLRECGLLRAVEKIRPAGGGRQTMLYLSGRPLPLLEQMRHEVVGKRLARQILRTREVVRP